MDDCLAGLLVILSTNFWKHAAENQMKVNVSSNETRKEVDSSSEKLKLIQPDRGKSFSGLTKKINLGPETQSRWKLSHCFSFGKQKQHFGSPRCKRRNKQSGRIKTVLLAPVVMVTKHTFSEAKTFRGLTVDRVRFPLETIRRWLWRRKKGQKRTQHKRPKTAELSWRIIRGRQSISILVAGADTVHTSPHGRVPNRSNLFSYSDTSYLAPTTQHGETFTWCHFETRWWNVLAM